MAEAPPPADTFVIQMIDVPKVKEKREEIVTDFGVDIVFMIDPNTETHGSQWITIKGKSDEDVKSAKAFMIALCNPDVKEEMYFPGFPFFIFDALKGRIKRKIQRQFGVVLLMNGDGFIHAHGEELGVATAFSKLLYMYSQSKDTSNEEKQAASHFDRYVTLSGDEYASDLRKLTNLLKKEILEILDVNTPVVPSLDESDSKISKNEQLRKVIPPKATSSLGYADADVIQVDSSSQEESDLINLCSSDDSLDEDGIYESDDDDDAERIAKTEDDGPPQRPLEISLPPNFLIKAWIQANYEGTSNPNDFVNKADMLEHFCSHFSYSNHPELSNVFFDRLAVRIFPTDILYKHVKTKRTKSKHSRRRLICLRRRNHDSTVNHVSIPSTSLASSTSTAGVNSSSATMKDWNSSRAVVTPTSVRPISKQPVRAVQPAPQFQNPPQSSGLLPTPTAPYQITQHHVKKQTKQPAENWPGMGEWLTMSTPSVPRHPVPARRTQTAFHGETLAARVAKMTNRELIRKPRPRPDPNLRSIVIDGSNIAVRHGNGERFSCRGIALCVRYFIERGHGDVVCLVPNYRKGGGGSPPSYDASLLIELEEMGIVKSTPSRRINGQNVVCYDDRFIVELAATNGGAIVSNDQYRDLIMTSPQWRSVIEKQLLQYTVVGDLFMFPDDPQGRNGPTLEDFLKSPNRKKSTQSPTVEIPGLYRPSLRQNTPPRNVWSGHTPGVRVTTPLSPQRVEMMGQMTLLMPHKKNEIEMFVKQNPNISGIDVMMDRFLRIHNH